MLDITQLQLPFGFSLPFLIGTALEILISGFIFRMSLMAVGGQIKLSRALIFSLAIRLINLIISLFVPPIFHGLYPVVLNGLIWLILVMKLFKVGFVKAVFVAIIQAIITFVFIFLGVPYFIKSIKD